MVVPDDLVLEAEFRHSGAVFRYGTYRESSGPWQYALRQNFGSSAGILTAAIKA